MLLRGQQRGGIDDSPFAEINSGLLLLSLPSLDEFLIQDWHSGRRRRMRTMTVTIQKRGMRAREQ
jgi:hypothetical protein